MITQNLMIDIYKNIKGHYKFNNKINNYSINQNI